MFALMILAVLVMFVVCLGVTVLFLIAAFAMAWKQDKRTMFLFALVAWLAGTGVMALAPFINQLFQYTTTHWLEVPLVTASMVWLLICVGIAGAGFLARRWTQRAPAVT